MRARVRYHFVLLQIMWRTMHHAWHGEALIGRARGKLTLAGCTLTLVGPPIPPVISGTWLSPGSTGGAPAEGMACAHVQKV